MGIFSSFFKKKKSKNLEDLYEVEITNQFIQVIKPNGKIERISWIDIEEIKLQNTTEGPFLPDIWLILMGKNSVCSIPHGNKKYDEIYDIVSEYEGFNHKNVIKSMSCTDFESYFFHNSNV